tara:strand:+ start:8631 stop:9365 length:735 start_codon:yes stop_codon:yes gene_type:complete
MKTDNSQIIQSLWIGNKLSQVEKLCISSYIHHGHEFHLYSYNDIDGLPQNCTIKDASDILPKEEIFSYNVGLGKGSYSAFSNYFRYKLLNLKGNWWTDTDIVCLKKFDFEDEYVFASEKTSSDGNHITSGVIKAPKDSLFSQKCYEFCREQDKDTLPWGVVGPKLVSKIVKELNIENFVKPWKFFNPIGFEQLGMIFDETFGNMKLDDSYAVHLWNEMWRRNNLDKNRKYEENCLFEKLKKKYL